MLDKSEIYRLRNRRFLTPEEVKELKTQIESGDRESSYEKLRLLWEARAWNLVIAQATWHLNFAPASPTAYAYWSNALGHLGCEEGVVCVTMQGIKACDEAVINHEHAKLFLLEGELWSARLAFDQSFRPWEDRGDREDSVLTHERQWRLFLRHHAPSKLLNPSRKRA
ncbi:hypothetical protein IEN85_16295 [Pelagicoccus sp. NFK12]|uniref:Uncharacterized protein n=1 Tax=Pelagicoccus enzymogenes TaxID=2773457 RepID=A0A927FB16_9BACT|nr:hypothetical protein [Pelagicoccus enzymogenes]MBD5781061.1 hypothetical protein [Pelagicoccus enzymogenes]